MTAFPSDSLVFAPLLGDAETARLFSDRAAVHAMLAFEVALARAEERVGLVPPGASEAIASAVSEMEPDWHRLGRASVEFGHPVAELVDQIRARVGDFGDCVHRGATAQDVMDTALVMRIKVALDQFDSRLRALIGELAQLAERHRDVAMPGRTRYQQAVPVTFGLKAAGWLLPLVRHRKRLAAMRPQIEVVQFGGAAGTLAALGGEGLAVTEILAFDLGLGVPAAPWHSQRDGFAELASWLSLLTASLAKVGQDVVLLAQSEVAEVCDGSAGASSSMPHKSNPVRSETLVAIGRANANLLSTMHQAVIHEHERSGGAWTLEWLTLPQMVVLAGAALGHAQSVIESLSTDPGRMLKNIGLGGGLALAEAAVAALATRMPAGEARRIVKSASQRARRSGEGLIAILEQEVPAGVDWASVEDPSNWLGSAHEFIDRAIALARSHPD